MIVLSAKDITKTYGVDTILEDVSFHINEGDRVGIVGANGAGKTTLLNILSGELPADGGQFFLSQSATIGYLKQKNNFDTESTVLEEVQKIFKPIEEMEQELTELSVKISEMGAAAGCVMNRYAQLQDTFANEGGYAYKSEMYGILNSMAFGQEYYDKKISTLSGGERTRLALACLLLEKPDILFLDEPTNHLDIDSKEVFEEALLDYPGTVIVVSHDRYFLNKIPTRILELEKNGLTEYLGTYDYYVEKKAAVESGRKYLKEMAEGDGEKAGKQPLHAGDADSCQPGKERSAAEERALKKKKEAEERRIAREKERLEELIAKLENAISENELKMCDEANLTNHQYLTELTEENAKYQAELADAYEKWMNLE